MIEEESRRAFENATPAEWVVRSQESDYGIDLQVQIFEDNKATNLFFFVQLKGSDSLDVDGEVAGYRFKTERLRHYLDLTIPVMLVAYDAKSRRLFYDWVHAVWAGLDAEGVGKWHMQDSVAVRLSHFLSLESQKTVSSEVRQFYRERVGETAVLGPVTIQIVVNGGATTDESRRATADLASWAAKKDRSGKLRFVERDAEVELAVGVEERCLIWRRLRSSGRIELGSVRNDLSEPAFIAFVRVYLCLMLSAAGLRDLALELLRSIVLEESGVFSEPLLVLMQPQISTLFAKARRSYEGVELAEFLIEKGHVDAAVTLAVAVAAKGTEYVRQTYRGLLKRALGLVVEERRKATILYGLANSLRCSGCCREAFVTYLAAAQSDPDYYRREYWWSETAGSLFVSGHHRLSRVYYEVAVALAGEGTAEGRRIGALLADVLLALGDYPEARRVFDAALKDEERPIAEFVLKRWMAGFFAERFGRQFRRKGVALRMAQEAYRRPNEQQEELLSKVLPVDALCSFAWFNYAEALVQRGGEDGTGARLVTAILNWDWDCEASALAVLMLFLAGSVGDLWLMSALLDESVRRQGGGFWHALEKAIRVPAGREGQAREIVEKLREFAEKSTLMFRHPSDDAVTFRLIA
ncbi:DUF4365 domain-containing protein [Corallococcus exercitus]|uniref:DUF4365 domain-containing protein n=1 Tax=Corallococcus exercitus TaxID=2316736 RepID=UPI0035D41C3C